jgi:hypothetical protein
MTEQVITYLATAWSHLTLCYHVDSVPAGTAGTLRNVAQRQEPKFPSDHFVGAMVRYSGTCSI